MKVIFAGTPEFATIALDALIHSSHDIVAVYTQRDKPAGRGLKLTQSPVKQLALANHLPVFEPTTLKTAEEQATLASFNADVMVVAAYGMLLPAGVLTIPRLGCINIHPSLLPRWRGAAPIQRTLHAGDTITGVTIMKMDVGLDTGPILLQHQYAPELDETTQTLHDHLAKMGAQSLIETLSQLEAGCMTPRPQDDALATYAKKITKEEARVDWSLPAIQIEQMIRAFNPWPIAYTTWKNENLRLWQAKARTEEQDAEPGIVLKATNEGLEVTTGKGVLSILQLQLPGGKPISVADFLNAHRAKISVGEKL